MFLTNEKALVLGDYLVIADVHLGITRELYEAGVRVPSQVRTMAERLRRLKKRTKSKKLVILGDLKHTIPNISYQELREVPDFLSQLDFESVIITKGNHDGNIERMLPDELQAKVRVRKSFAIGNYVLTHGHRTVATKKNIIVGHNHPHVKFIDALGNRYVQPCWVRGTDGARDIIMVPAFNDLSGAMIVNQPTAQRGFRGPLVKLMNRDTARVHLLDGTDLGRIKDIMMKE